MKSKTQNSVALPKTSPGASANTPSEEFRYTWWEPAMSEYGSWHRSKDSALAEANDNYHGFHDNFKERDVYIVECVGVANAATPLSAGSRE